MLAADMAGAIEVAVGTEAEVIEADMEATEMAIAAIMDIKGTIMDETIGIIIEAEEAIITDTTEAEVIGIMVIEVADGAVAGEAVGVAGAGTDIGTAIGQVLGM